MQAILFSVATFVASFGGGLLAIKLRNKLNYIMAFTAGVLLAVVCFDILPEIFEQVEANGFDMTYVMIALVFGFMLFHILEKTILIHHAHENDYAEHKHPEVGVISSLALTGHSFMDGVSIGFGFQINETVGLMVAMAVIAHGFTDGMNTIALMLKNNNSTNKSKFFLFLNAIAPILGAISTLFITVSPYFLVLYLGFFAGFLLYICASDILPEAHSGKSSYKLISLTILGILLIFAITRLA